ncbi:MAG TPA: hypothetical protein VHE55_13935 [Fimbriimonadaceae bacterium]|nr:hypothetical protein [Fimbriimonadaceae bacterium]
MIGSNGISVGSPFTTTSATYSVPNGGGIRMQLPQRQSTFGLNMGGVDWSQYSHVVVSLTNNQSTPVMVEFAIDSGASGWAWSDFLIGAGSTETIALPLSTPTSTGLPSIDGTTSQTATYGAVSKNNIRMVRFWNCQRSGGEDLTINSLSVANYPSRTTGLVDQYGQQTVSFAGKVTADSQLLAQASTDANLSGVLPYSSDPYGGVAGTGTGATGKWSVAKQNGKWYILTPSGNRFFSTGVVSTGVGTNAYTAGRSSLFADGLPSPTGPFGDCYQYPVNPSTGQPETGFNFYLSNLQRKYGSSWHTPAMQNIARRLRTWGFNTVGPSSDNLLYDTTTQMANTQEVTIKGSFRTVPCPNGSFAMPDVYDPAWATAVTSTLTPMVTKLNNDPYNIGLFVDDELPWAWNMSQTNYRYDLAFNVLSAPATQPAKVRFYNTLVSLYRTVARLNSAWGTNFTSWTAFLNNTSFHPTNITTSMAKDLQNYLTAYNTLYFSTIRSKLTALHFKGLYLGCRLAYYSPETLVAAGRYADVISFNAYDLKPSTWRSDIKALDRPVMVSEFGFGAADQGRVGAGYPVAISETDRVQAYQTYVADVMTWPNMVGLHWYKWDDDPATGRMWDNANESRGLVSITDTPYSQMVAAVTAANTQLNTRLTNP